MMRNGRTYKKSWDMIRHDIKSLAMSRNIEEWCKIKRKDTGSTIQWGWMKRNKKFAPIAWPTPVPLTNRDPRPRLFFFWLWEHHALEDFLSACLDKMFWKKNLSFILSACLENIYSQSASTKRLENTSQPAWTQPLWITHSLLGNQCLHFFKAKHFQPNFFKAKHFHLKHFQSQKVINAL